MRLEIKGLFEASEPITSHRLSQPLPSVRPSFFLLVKLRIISDFTSVFVEIDCDNLVCEVLLKIIKF